MTYSNSIRTTDVASGRFGAFVLSVRDALRKRSVYNVTLRELRNLSDRDLTDLGIHRTMIQDVAREAAYGN